MFNDLLTEDLLFESTDLAENTEPIFVMLTHTGTVLSNLIKKFTGVPYSHASISFDSSMTRMYSFGRKYPKNFLIGTFVIENIRQGLYKNVENHATYSLYVTFVTPQEKQAMLDRLEEFSSLHQKKELKYNFIGLLYNKLNIPKERGDKFFCSQFVATVLESGKKFFSKPATLVRPYDYAKHKEFKFVKKGLIKNYDSSEVDRKVESIKAANRR